MEHCLKDYTLAPKGVRVFSFFLRIIFCKFANVEKSSINTQKIFCIKGFMFEDRITEEKTGNEFKVHGWFLGKPVNGYFNLSENSDGTYTLHKYLQIPPLQT